jgi:hypothetical protein
MGCMCLRDRDKPAEKETLQLAQTPHDSYTAESTEIRKRYSRSVVKLESSLSCDEPALPSYPITSSDAKDAAHSAHTNTGKMIEGIRVVSGGAECCYRMENESLGNLVTAEHRETRKKCWVQKIALKKKDIGRKQQLTLLRSLSHPNILPLLDLFQDQRYLYAVYEGTEGGNAKQL